MAWTQADIDALKAAMATGARLVRYSDGRTVEYRTLAEMREQLQLMTDEVAAPAATASRVSYAHYSRD